MRYFAYDGAGEILQRTDGTINSSGVFTPGGVGATYAQQQAAVHHQAYVNGQLVASTDDAGKVDAESQVTGFASSAVGSSVVVVQDSETLQGIAQRIYGNASLWYVLAAANGLDANATLACRQSASAVRVICY